MGKTRLSLSCLLGRHAVVAHSVRTGSYEFGHCPKCRCDLLGTDGSSKRVPKGFRVVWRFKAANGSARGSDPALSREVSLHGVSVIGERTIGSQRIALVVLNAKDERNYGALVDLPGTAGPVAEMLRSRASLLSNKEVWRRDSGAVPDHGMTRGLTETLLGTGDERVVAIRLTDDQSA